MGVGTKVVGTAVPPYTEGDTLIKTWDGTSWAVTPSPDVGASGSDDTLTAVSCVGVSDCTAVGDETDGTADAVDKTLVESWDGPSWPALTTAAPPTSTS